MLRVATLGLLLAATGSPDVKALVAKALGPGIVPHPAVKPVITDFNGDGRPDLIAAVDFNRYLATWLRRGTTILNLDDPALAPMKPDNEQHFCFGLLFLDGQDPQKKTIFYGCFSGWRVVPGVRAALDLDMDSGSVLRLYHDGSRFRTRRLTKN